MYIGLYGRWVEPEIWIRQIKKENLLLDSCGISMFNESLSHIITSIFDKFSSLFLLYIHFQTTLIRRVRCTDRIPGYYSTYNCLEFATFGRFLSTMNTFFGHCLEAICKVIKCLFLLTIYIIDKSFYVILYNIGLVLILILTHF